MDIQFEGFKGVYTLPTPLKQNEVVFEPLKNGDSADMNVNASASAQKFQFRPGQRLYLSQISFIINDSDINLNGIGALSALTNGIKLMVLGPDNSEVGVDLLNGHAVQSFSDLYMLGEVTRVTQNLVLGVLAVNFNFHRIYGGNVVVEANEYVTVQVEDNLTGLSRFNAYLMGNYASQA